MKLLLGKISLFLLVAFIIGCAGDKPEVTYKLPSTTKEITSNDESSVLDVRNEGATIVLDGDSSLAGNLSSGDVLMFTITSKSPNGMLRKVTSLSSSGGDVVVETEQATMEEAFKELDLTARRPLHYEEMQNYETNLSGLSVKRSPLTIEGGTEGSYEINFDGTVLYDLDGNSGTTQDQIVANGSISFSLSINFDVLIEWFKLKRVKVGSEIQQTGELEVFTSTPVLDFDKQVVVASLYFAPFALGPVVITPEIDLIMGANGKLNVNVSASLTEQIDVTAGAVYENGSWYPYSNYYSDWIFTPPQLTASASLKAYLGPRFNLMIYGVAGPYCQVNAFLQLDADISKNPWWELYGGIEALVGVRGEILGYDLLEYESGDLIGYRKLLADAGGPFSCIQDCSGRECGPDGCGGTCAPGCGAGETCNESTGQCEGCTPACAGKECGPDGCGSTCAPGCGAGETCNDSIGQCEGCIPNCSGKECGDDGCGGSCGSCSANEACEHNTCVLSGNPQFTLTWNNTADIDLYVFTPCGTEIWYGATSSCSGALDVDDRCTDHQGVPGGPENIYWLEGAASAGKYVASVKYFAECESEGSTNYTLIVRKGGTENTYNGTLSFVGEVHEVTTVTVP